MDALRLIPQLFFDLLARVVPGVVLLLIVAALHTNGGWKDLLNIAAGGRLDPENAFAFAFFIPLGVGFVLGHLIAPIGKTLGGWVRHPGFKAPWREYDWLRMHRPDAGALVAKIRAEYTMHYSLAAAFAIGLVAGIAMHAHGYRRRSAPVGPRRPGHADRPVALARARHRKDLCRQRPAVLCRRAGGVAGVAAGDSGVRKLRVRPR